MQEEEVLLEQLKLGDEDAYRRVVQKYQPKVYNTCIGFVKDPEIARDLSQEVFLELYRSISKFRGDSKLSTWLYRISVNKSLNHLKSNQKHQWIKSLQSFFGSEDEPQKDLPDRRQSNAIELLEQNELSSQMHQALNRLSESQRTAFILKNYDELSYKEIAEVMNVTFDAVESLLHRAKSNLQKHLLETYQNYIS
jgi:RNA polymerase sigma-70 factor (ECF subfamily)